MQKKYLVSEIVTHFHTITLDEELNIEEIIDWANNNAKLYDTGYEAIEAILERYKEKYGFEYGVEPNDCGTEVLDMDVVEEM